MSNVVVNSNQVPTFQNEELNKATREIFEYDKNIRLNYFKIADAFRWIKGLELYKDDGFKSVSEYAGQVFGYEKSTVSRMIKIAEEYLMEDGSSTVFVQEGKDFSISQLREVLVLPRGEVVDLVQEGQITPDMTKDEIRAVVKAKKNQKSSNQNDISVKEENIVINQSCASATQENKGISSLEHELKCSEESISSSVYQEHELKQSDNLSSETSSHTAQNALESLSNSSVVLDTSEGSRTSQNSLSDSSGYQPISNNDIDFMIAQLAGDEESKEEYPLVSYEFIFFNCRKEVSELKRVDSVELDELVYSDVLGKLPSELKDCFELLRKEIKRLNHFRHLESARMEELIREIERLKEENFKLLHPVKRGRGRPRKNQ